MSEATPGAQALVETWTIGARITRYLLDGVHAATLDASPAGKGRTVRDLFAHLHDVRQMWLKAARPDLMTGLAKLGSGSTANHAALAAALDASAAAVAVLVADSAAAEADASRASSHTSRPLSATCSRTRRIIAARSHWSPASPAPRSTRRCRMGCGSGGCGNV